MSGRYSDKAERILTNIINAADGQEKIYRQAARYPVIDIPAEEFDEALEKWGVPTYIDHKVRAKYYILADVKTALKKLCLQRGIRPKLNPEALR